MIEKHRYAEHLLAPHSYSIDMKLCVCVRKRPIFDKELNAGENDAVSCANPQIKVHFPKVKVDGITKYIDNHLFTFDNTFNENESNEDLYQYSMKKLLPLALNKTMITIFAYGQTGSGKTFTMQGMTNSAIKDLYKLKANDPNVNYYVTFYEIYGGRCYDLLNKKQRVQILEDGNNWVNKY